MASRPSRRMTLADLSIVVAGSAFLFFLIRQLNVAQSAPSLFPGRLRLPSFLFSCLNVGSTLLAVSATLLAIRLRESKVRWGCLVRRPGTMACLTFLVSFTFSLVVLFGRSIAFKFLQPNFHFFPFALTDISYLLMGTMDAGEFVAGAWCCMVAFGRWRPEPTWIDRAGRLVGFASILVLIVTRFDR